MSTRLIDRRAILAAAALAPLAGKAFSGISGGRARPNILLLFPDQLRFDWIGRSGDVARTPNIDRLAARGHRFHRVYCSSPICAPSRAGLILGCEYDLCGVPDNWTDLPRDRENYLMRLRSSGYRVAASGKLDLSKGVRSVGLDGQLYKDDWGFTDLLNCGGKLDAVSSWRKEGSPTEPYMAYLASKGLDGVHAADIEKRAPPGSSIEYQYSQVQATSLTDIDYCDNWIGRTGLDMLREFPRSQPWHLIVNFTGPHHPMDVTASMLDSVRGRRFRAPPRSNTLSASVHNDIRANYTAMIENIDRWVGQYVDALISRDELDNTYIVFASDHGEMLGDYGRWAKRAPYDPSVGVPLIISGPGVKTVESEALVSLIDLSATFLDFAGAAKPEGMTARSLRSMLEGKTTSHREVLHSGVFNWRLVRDARFKLIRGFDPERDVDGSDYETSNTSRIVLFDLENDPFEAVDFSGRYPEVVKRLSTYLPAQPVGGGYVRPTEKRLKK